MVATVYGKFGSGEFGTGAAVSWANAPYADFWPIPGADPFAATPIPAAFLQFAQPAFRQWEAVADASFAETGNWFGANILLGMTEIDGSFGDLARAVGNPDNGRVAIGIDRADFRDFSDATVEKAVRAATRAIGDALGIHRGEDEDAIEVPHTAGLAAQELSDPVPWADGGATILSPLEIAAVQYLYGAPAEYVSQWTDSRDALFAGSTGSRISARGGNDTVVGRDGDDVLYGNTGLDLLDGGGGDDALYGGQNAGTPRGTATDPKPRMRDGVETLSGGAGDDVLYGNYGPDILDGGADNDLLFGGKGGDTLRGGAGDDTLHGNKGDDLLTGGAGADLFRMSGGGTDTVTDFDPAEGDRLSLPAGLLNATASPGGNLVIRHATGGVELVGVSPEDWNPAGWLVG